MYSHAGQTPVFQVENLTFAYPEQPEPALEGITLTVEPGEFLVVCGPSGCGKSTLLRQLKPALAPHGRRSGEILFHGVPLSQLDAGAQAAEIGFVQQSPENQIVTDKVWHELAFGLESLGYDTPTIRRRVAEMASFFGIQTWFYKNVTELSGGQKQLLNLAAVMAMQPRVLILDEPTSQLDPIAAADFLATLGKLNRELGTTILLIEHRLEEAFGFASRVAVLEQGRLLCTGTPSEVGTALRQRGSAMFLAMPAAMRIWSATDSGADCPVSVCEGRGWLRRYAGEHPLRALPDPAEPAQGETVVTAQELWFRYEQEGPDVVRGLSLTLDKGELLALLGGNGTGKTTTLKLLAGLKKPLRGELRVTGRVVSLPQNPQTLFTRPTLREDLLEVLPKAERRSEKLARVVGLCRLETLLDRHPYDLSGGEQQRAALAKVLLLDPDVLLLDEPTKGLDAEFKQAFGQILRSLRAAGTAILMVSHDIEFCARYADRCALFFDGGIVTQDAPRAFFSGNSFYTTAANRMAREVLPGAVTAEDVIRACGGEPEPEEPLPEYSRPLPEAPREQPRQSPKLPLWRRVLACASGLVALVLTVQAIGITDLTQLVDAGGMTALAGDQLRLYALLLAALLTFALSIGRKAPQPEGLLQTPVEKRRLRKRTVVATALILLLIPLTLFVGVYYFGGRRYYALSLAILLECMLPFFLIFEGRRPQARELVLIAVLCAMNVAGRAVFFMLPEFKPVVAMTILAGVAFGGETGFLVGAVTMLVSNMLFSQGPWTPWQMFAMGLIGWLAGVLYRKGVLRRGRLSLCIFGVLCATVVYGGIMNPASALMWAKELNWKLLLSYYLTGIPVDLVRAVGTFVFLWLGAEPMLEKLDRIKVKYGLVE